MNQPRLLMLAVVIAGVTPLAHAERIQREQLGDRSMSCGELESEVYRMEDLMGMAEEDQAQARDDQRKEQRLQRSARNNPIAGILRTTKQVVEGVQGIAGEEQPASPSERHRDAQQTYRSAQQRRTHLMRLHSRNGCG